MMQEIYSGQAQIASSYNEALAFSITAEVRSNFLSLLNEEHQLQEVAAKQLEGNEWIPTPEVGSEEIANLLEKYCHGITFEQ